MNQSLKEQFLKFLAENDFDSAESLISSDIFDVEDMMDSMDEEDAKLLEGHWSAFQTGEQITTPVEILKRISDYIKFKKNSILIDIGSGHGHPSLVFSLLNPSLKITGYEIVKEKVYGSKKTAEKLELVNVNFITQDLSDENFNLPEADYYYIYNPANDYILKDLVDQIFLISKKQKICAISAGGEDIKYFRETSLNEDTSFESIGVSIFSN